MKRKRLVVTVLTIFLAFQAALAFAQSQIVYEVIAADELIDIDLEIPENVAPGYHQMLVEVLDDNGVVRSKVALFCKDTDGTVSLDNVCPGLVAAGITGSDEIVTPGEAKFGDPFDPKNNPEQTQGLLVTLFALATVLLTSQKPDETGREDGEPSEQENEEDRGSLESVNAGGLAVRPLLIGRGDKKRSRRSRSDGFDLLAPDIAKIANRISYIVARVILDARYLRTMIGSATWLLSLVTAYCAWRGVNEINREALPLNYSWLLIIMVIAIFDAFAGFYASLVYFFSVLVAGNLDSFTSLITVLGTMIVMYAPALIAGTFRPLQRTIDSKSDLWDRITDYAVGILLSAMAVQGLVSALSGLSGITLEVADQASDFAIAAAVALFIRMILEERAWYHYPQTLREQTIEITNATGFRGFIKSFNRLFLFVAFTLPFVGPTTGFVIGLAIYLLSQVLPRINVQLPKSRVIGQLLPSGVATIVLLSIVGGFISFWLAQRITNPGHLIEATFWVMALPSLVLTILAKAKGEPYLELKSTSKIKTSFIVLSLMLYALLVATVFGVDLSEIIRSGL